MEEAPGLPPASKIIRDAMGFFQCSPKAFLRRNQMIKIKFLLFSSITFTQFLRGNNYCNFSTDLAK